MRFAAAELIEAGSATGKARRLVVATADPATLPDKATWYLVTSLPRPGGPRAAESPRPAAGLAEITRIYGIRHWTGQSYKQARDQLGRAGFQARSDTAIRRHQALASAAFSFCRDAWSADTPPRHHPPSLRGQNPAAERGGPPAASPPRAPALPPAPSWPRALRAIRAWLTPRSRCSAGGRHGPTRPRHRSCRP